jgi:tetratricopeptide (TPR) repeat protein
MRGRTAVAGGALVVAGLLAIGYGATSLAASGGGRPSSSGNVSAPLVAPATDPLSADIVRLQGLVRANPSDSGSLALLGLDYVAQAKATGDPSYYPKAEGVLDSSLALNPSTGFQAMAGKAALKAAQHDFTGARAWARRGLAVDPYNATLYGSLTDAETQLGHYDAAAAAAQKMLDLKPGVPSLTRGEYVYELRGQLPQARDLLRRALEQAGTPGDRAFVHSTSAELALATGDAPTALREAEAGLAAQPTYRALLSTKARAEAALGRVDDALRDFAQVVAAVPEPQYLVEYGEYLDSLGRHDEATQQYALFEAEAELFRANGVALDTEPTLFYADHGNPAKALEYGQKGLRARPFVEMQDAYAWALHANGRDAEALTYARRAAALGTRNALFLFHRGMIEKSLGQRTEALADLRAALSLNPHFSPRAVPLARAAVQALSAR